MSLLSCGDSQGEFLKHSLLTVACLLFVAGACAQSPSPFLADLQHFYNIRKGDVLKAADRMPAGDYDFRPTPEVRTFGQLIAHIAEAQMGFCSGVNGTPKQLDAASKKSKNDLVAALKSSFEECDRAFASTSDASAMQQTGGADRSKFGSMLYATLHDTEEYGYLAVYLRLKHLVPPSTDSR